jgi:hypothetical protein
VRKEKKQALIGGSGESRLAADHSGHTKTFPFPLQVVITENDLCTEFLGPRLFIVL